LSFLYHGICIGICCRHQFRHGVVSAAAKQ
jgi:hypothetical protein